MKKRGEKNIFIGGSLYSLLLYLLVAKSDDICLLYTSDAADD